MPPALYFRLPLDILHAPDVEDEFVILENSNPTRFKGCLIRIECYSTKGGDA